MWGHMEVRPGTVTDLYRETEAYSRGYTFWIIPHEHPQVCF